MEEHQIIITNKVRCIKLYDEIQLQNVVLTLPCDTSSEPHFAIGQLSTLQLDVSQGTFMFFTTLSADVNASHPLRKTCSTVGFWSAKTDLQKK